MSVSVDYFGRTGNQLFQYVYARMYAEYQGLQLMTEWPHQDFIKTTPVKPGKRTSGREYRIRDVDNRRYSPWHKQQRPGGRIKLHGYFQWAKFFEGEEERILGYFKLSKSEIIPVDSDVVGMHVRLGDYRKVGKGGSVISPRWYANIIKNIKPRHVCIYTDGGKNDSWFKDFGKLVQCTWKVESHDLWLDPGDPSVFDFHDLMSFETLIIANSSFSWWAAYLSRAQGIAKEVYAFKPWIRVPKNHVGIDLANTFTPVDGEFYAM